MVPLEMYVLYLMVAPSLYYHENTKHRKVFFSSSQIYENNLQKFH